MFIFNLENIVIATVIAVIIAAISSAKSPKLKAIIYALPIPVTTLLVATGKGVNQSHLIGLVLLVTFLWGVYFLHKVLPIIFADIFATLGYIGGGLVLFNQPFIPSFFRCLIILIIALSILLPIIKKKAPATTVSRKIPTLLKGLIVFLVTLILLAIKDSLGGIAVTFPLSGIFAVVEVRENLYLLTRNFTVTLPAILCFFTIIFICQTIVSLYVAILLGWIGYLLILLISRKIDDKITT